MSWLECFTSLWDYKSYNCISHLFGLQLRETQLECPLKNMGFMEKILILDSSHNQRNQDNSATLGTGTRNSNAINIASHILSLSFPPSFAPSPPFLSHAVTAPTPLYDYFSCPPLYHPEPLLSALVYSLY